MKKTLSLLIVIAMLFAMMPAVFAAEGDTVSIDDGQYVISYGDLTYQALAEEKSYGYATAGDVNALTDVDYITVTNTGDGQFTMQDCYGRYIYMKGTYNSFNVSAEMPTEGYLWTVEETEGGMLLKNVEKEKYIAYSEQYTSWGCYASTSETSVLTLTAIGGEDSGEGELRTITLLEETAVVQDGDMLWNGKTFKVEAPADGTATLTLLDDVCAEYWLYISGGSKSFYYSFEDGLTQSIEVAAGDEIVVNICFFTDETASAYSTGECDFILEFTGILPEEEAPAGTPVVDGDNLFELPYGATEASIYSYVATQTGTLYVVVVDFLYSYSETSGYYDNMSYLGTDWPNTLFTVNGEELENGFYGSVEVVEGETYTFSWSHREGDPYGYQATINLGYTDELVPVAGIDFQLTPSMLPMDTVEIAAGEMQLYTISYDFSGYILTVTGENAYIYYSVFDWWTYEQKEVRIDAVDGVVEYDLDTHGVSQFYIGNDGSEPATFTLDCYAPLGGINNPHIIESLDEVVYSASAEEQFGVYFQWVAETRGTVVVDASLLVANGSIWFENVTKQETGEWDSNNCSIYVEPGDVLLICLSGYATEDTFCTMPYEFVEGYRLGSEENPISVDLETGMNVDAYNETVHYVWTPTQSGTVTLNFTYLYSWSSNLPTITINGEAITLGVIPYGGTEVETAGVELTVTAGEPVYFSLSTINSVYGTLQAVAVEAEGGEGSGTMDDPWIVESLPTVIEGTFTNENDVDHYYNYEVTEAGTVYVESFSGCLVSFMLNGEIVAEPITVAVGDVLTINPWYLYGDLGDYTVSIGFTPAEGGESGDVEENTELVLGDNAISIASGETFSPEYTFTPETDGLLTLELVFLQSTYWDQIKEYTADEIAEMLSTGSIGLQVDGVDYTEPVAVTAGTTVTITMSQGRMYSMYGYSWEATLNVAVGEDEGGDDPIVSENTLVPGDNSLEMDIEYTYTVEEAGSLVLLFSNVKYGYGGTVSASNLGRWLDITINGTAIDSFYNIVRAEAGDVITVKIISLDGDNYYGDLNISYAQPAIEIALGDNELASYQEYVYTAEKTGTLYFTVKDLYNENWAGTEWDLGYSVNININGEAITSFKHSIEVTEGDVITVTMIPSSYTWNAVLNLSFDGFYEHPLGSERNPVVLDFADCPTVTPVIGAGEEFYYTLNNFSDAILYVYGENAYIVYSDWDDTAQAYVEMYVYAVDGVVTYSVVNSTIRIGNAGTEPAEFDLEAYLPEGHTNNPDELEIGDNIAEIPAYQTYYFYWVATEDGTLTITLNGEHWAFNLVNEGQTDGWEDNYYSDSLYAAWSETNSITIEVKAGDYIKVNVWTYNASDYTSPASTVTVTMDFVPAGGGEDIVMGDANGDGAINHLDAMLIAQYYVGAIADDALTLDAADVNGDGVVNHLDAMLIAQYYVGLITEFPNGN